MRLSSGPADTDADDVDGAGRAGDAAGEPAAADTAVGEAGGATVGEAGGAGVGEGGGAGVGGVDEAAELDAGVEAGLDPQPSGAATGRADDGPPGRDGSRAAVTHSESWWTHLRCARCRHTFRRGDRVRLRADAAIGDATAVVHLDPALRCADGTPDARHPASGGASARDTSRDAAKGAREGTGNAGKDTANGSTANGSSANGASGDAEELAAFAAGLLVAWPPAGDVPVVRLAAHAPQVARPGPGLDAAGCLVCGHTFRPGEQVVVCPCGMYREVCVAAVHRDPVAGLTCWDDWRPDGGLTHCPVTLNRVADR
ncbi:hypothetical protein [Frankia sp. CiP1_Cm_nod2]|uniref:hypothetical protein n=1 Tax=Frankia sp. CiP1_Cm_nod2 TaxID=2897161 RepID=UPI002024D373